MIIHEHNVMFMVICMFFAGFASTMNNWIDKWEDARFSLNDFYMTGLMIGWMFFFMGLFYKEHLITVIVFFLVIVNIWCIRNQFFVTQNQYILGMIPHHSMAVLMSKKLLNKKNNIKPFLENLIKTQDSEIIFMKDKI